MKPSTVGAPTVLTAAVVVGFLGNLLLRVEYGGPPGVNFPLFGLAVIGTALLLFRRHGLSVSREALLLFGTGLLLLATMAWRDAGALKVMAVAAAVLAFALPAARAGAAWVRRSTPVEAVAALIAGGVNGALGVLLLLRPSEWPATTGRPKHEATLLPALRGIALATPLLLVFGALFLAADQVLEAYVQAALPQLDIVLSHVALTFVLGWIVAGYLRGATAGTLPPQASLRPPAFIGITEASVALGLVQLLFLAFVLVQFRYLFGGTALVEVTPGLSYAEYARAGFFELVMVVLLVLPMLIIADALVRRGTAKAERLFGGLVVVQMLLVFAVMASAATRMRMYQAAYGLTEARFYGSALLVLLAVVVLLVTAALVRSRSEWIAPGAAAALFAWVLALNVVNPDALIARVNLDRWEDRAAGLDVSYVASLSADAIPVVLAGLPRLPEDSRCRVAARVLDRWGGDAPPLRAWSLSLSQARHRVADHGTELVAAAALCGDAHGS
jgi:hypothetical protein